MSWMKQWCPNVPTFHSEVFINLSWPSDAMYWHSSWLTLAQVMTCCLMATCHYLNQIQQMLTYGLLSDGSVSLPEPNSTNVDLWLVAWWYCVIPWIKFNQYWLMACCLMVPYHYLNQIQLMLTYGLLPDGTVSFLESNSTDVDLRLVAWWYRVIPWITFNRCWLTACCLMVLCHSLNQIWIKFN